MRGHPALDTPADVRAHCGGRLLHASAARANVDEPSALDRAEECCPGECEVTFKVRDALVEVSGGTAKRRERLDDPAGAPLFRVGRRHRSTDGHRDAGVQRSPRAPLARGDHLGPQHREPGLRRRVLQQAGAHGDRTAIGGEWLLYRAMLRVSRQRQRGAEKSNRCRR
jgi:hypothetical protein